MPRAGRALAARYTIGIDMGGTFVDAAVMDGTAIVALGKAPTVPGNPTAGVFAVLSSVAAEMGRSAPDLLAATEEIVHGATVGLNALLTRAGSRVGLITTRGHEDAILIGRVHQKIAGIGTERMRSVSTLAKPDPIVPRWRIHGIDERIDHAGREIVPLDEGALVSAARLLADDGCQAIAIAFLWSFRNPAHEIRAAELIRRSLPRVAVTISSAVAPVLGEYERTAATVVNAFLLESQRSYLGTLEEGLRDRGFGGRLSMMLSTGGAVPGASVEQRPVETLRSGPVGGAMATAHLGRVLGLADLLAADVGGTSFDVGLIAGGRPQLSDTSVVDQLHLAIPAVDVQSIGAGGGSIAWLDGDGGLHVGPQSSGAVPGPACYGQGGTAPTVTDADLLLGRLNPAAVLGGQIRLDRAAAERAIAPIARALGVDTTAVAAGIVRVADAAMADLIRRMTIERGHDPRDLPLVAFGGAGPLHAGAFGPDVGVRTIIVPRGASVFSALGLAQAERTRIYVRSGPLVAPLDVGAVQSIFDDMREAARRDLAADGHRGRVAMRREVDLRYRRQTHQVVVELKGDTLDAQALARLITRFEREYERVYGTGSAYQAAGIEATTFRLIATGTRRSRPAAGSVRSRRAAGEATPAAGRSGAIPRSTRPVFFDGWVEATPVHRGEDLRSGDWLAGPAVIDWATTTLVVHPGQTAVVEADGAVRLALRPDR